MIKYGYTASQVLPKEELFPALQQKRPNLNADRIDYSIQGAYHRGYITYDEALEILKDLQFVDGVWVATKHDLVAKLVRFLLFMTEDCWGSPVNYLSSRWLADAILRGIEIGCISKEDIHFGTDQDIWDRLIKCKDLFIQDKMNKISHVHEYFCLSDFANADLLIKSKFLGVDPWIIQDKILVRLTDLDKELADEYKNSKEKIERGWAITLY